MGGTRKTPNHWIKAGLKALQKDGVAGLRAESLARALGTTKGSFYWHFKDGPDFQQQVLDVWQSECLTRFDSFVADADSDVMKLRAVAKMRPTAQDRAVRAWALHHSGARKSVATVDQRMLARIADLLAAQDATHPDFPGLILAAILGSPAKGTHTETLIDLLLVLK